jgi:hypothetical protein
MDPVSSLQQQPQQQPLTTSAAKPATGTISGMLADFSKALGEFFSALFSRILLILILPVISDTNVYTHIKL